VDGGRRHESVVKVELRKALASKSALRSELKQTEEELRALADADIFDAWASVRLR
jgi:hypothetical protein